MTNLNSVLIKELRKRAIISIERLAYGKGTVLVGHECTVCCSDWQLNENESRKTDCVLKNTKSYKRQRK